MNLAILGACESSRTKAEGLTVPKHLIKINGEHLLLRIIRIAQESGVNKVYYRINPNEPELYDFLLSQSFNLPVNLLTINTKSVMDSLFALAPLFSKESFCLLTNVSVFSKEEFTQFIYYSKMQEDAEGILAITKDFDNGKPLCVAMDEYDTIIKFSDSKDGYGWTAGGIYYFSPGIFDEIDRALSKGVSGFGDFLRHLVSSGYKLKGFAFSKIIDIDYSPDIIRGR